MKNSLILILTVAILSGFSIVQNASEQESIDLPTIMRLIASKMDLINEGIFTKNYALIAEGAAGINDHPPLSDDTKSLIKETLGERMQAFAKYDNIVHSTADSLRTSAQKKDMHQILDYYRVIQQGCVNCHAAFQEEIREARIANTN